MRSDSKGIKNARERRSRSIGLKEGITKGEISKGRIGADARMRLHSTRAGAVV